MKNFVKFCYVSLIIIAGGVMFLSFPAKAEARPQITFEPLPSATEGQSYLYQLSATDGAKPYNWATPYPPECSALAPNSTPSLGSQYGFSLSSDGKIKANKIIIPAGAITPINHQFYVGLKDANGDCAVPRQFTIQISAESPTPTANPVIQTTEVPPGQINKEYKPKGNVFYFQASGGCDTNYKWQKFGDLPTGLTFKEDGSITGTPQVLGEKNFSVRVKDGCGVFSDNGNYKPFTIAIYPEIPLGIITQSLPQKGTNQTYQATLQAEGGLPPYKWEILFTDKEGNLFAKPAKWLTLTAPSGNAEMVELTGTTPSALGDYQFSILVVDSNYESMTKEFLITVTEGTSPTGGTSPSGKLEVNWPNSPMGTALTDNSKLTDLIKYLYEWGIALGGFAAFIALIIAGFQYLTSAGNAMKMKDSMDRIKSAGLGLVLLFGSFLILNTINPQLTKLDMPPFNPGSESPSIEAPKPIDISKEMENCTSATLYSGPNYDGTSVKITPQKPIPSLSQEVRSVEFVGTCQLNLYRMNDYRTNSDQPVTPISGNGRMPVTSETAKFLSAELFNLGSVQP